MTAESRAQELDALLNDPQFYVTRSQEASGLIKEMDEAGIDVEVLPAISGG